MDVSLGALPLQVAMSLLVAVQAFLLMPRSPHTHAVLLVRRGPCQPCPRLRRQPLAPALRVLATAGMLEHRRSSRGLRWAVPASVPSKRPPYAGGAPGGVL